ncbi:MAG TPA: dipeptide ABC transporter ATP-binding protein [Casimicrobiaceae bacterium]|nr:dipeptide ABC transporter ATP-binding protein [Casimicrobiaceae bacterium]
MSVLLEARGLARHYAVRRGFGRAPAIVRALDGVSFTLAAGTTLAVVGESGCGKSTLARQVTMVEAPTAGALLVDGVDVAHAGAAARKALRPRVQMVFQNPYASLNPRKNIGAILGEPLAIHHALAARARRDAARAALARVGLHAGSIDRYPHMFSGGQRQRIAIARALILDPALVVADEPVSALDVSIQAQVLNLLMDLQQASGVAYLFITHNLQVVRHIADDVVVMYFGRIVECSTRRTLFAAPAHPYTRALLASTPSLRSPRPRAPARGEPPSPFAPPAGCAFHRRCPFAIERCRVEDPVLRRVGAADVACHRAEELPPAS